MKVCFVLLGLLPAAAFAGTIVDVQTGVHAPGAVVEVSAAVVTGVVADGLYISEDPVIAGSGIFVHTAAAPAAVIGDLAHVKGVVQETGGRTVLDVPADPTGYLQIPGSHQGEIFPLSVTMAEIALTGGLLDGGYLQVDEGMSFSSPDAEGVWTAQSFEDLGRSLELAGLGFDAGGIAAGDCATCVRGVLAVVDGTPRLLVHEGGVCWIECTVAEETRTFGELKAGYR